MTHKNKSKQKPDNLELKQRALTAFQRNSNEPMNYKQVSKRMGINDDATRRHVPHALQELVDEKQIIETEPGRFKLNYEMGSVVGKVDLTVHGYAYIISPESDEDIFVSQKHLREALHGDTVKVHLFARRKGSRLEGQVVQIIERARTKFVGTIGITDTYAFLIPDSRLMPYDLFIPQNKLNGAKDGQKVVARIVEWPNRAKNPIGEVIQVLGDPGMNETEMHSILAEFDLPYHFEKEVEDVAATISPDITKAEIKGRRDFRGIPTLTIDPVDAKDFDDALSLQKLPNGNWEVGVHIADVTHYIKPGSILDKEAINRATSIYLVDRVVPMLPEKLSNNLCSLRPNEDKLCFSAVFELDDNAHVVKQWFGSTIICSNNRLSYEDAQAIIDTGKGTMSEEILTLHRLAQIFRKIRFQKGSISFDRAEPHFKLDKDGKPLNVFFVENTTSHQLIEEFMLLANRKVAEFCSGIMQTESPPRQGTGKTFVYRVHDHPNMEKLEAFAGFVSRFGYTLSITSEKSIASSLNNLLVKVKGTNEENIVENLALRAMAKADYSVDNIGHYGLGFKYYTHFTSPIRRYPDMMVHRLLKYYLDGKGAKPDRNELEALCKQSSNMERLSMEAERASIKYKQVEFMSDKVGQCFDGTISGVTEWGIYIELNESKCEGMIHIREFNDDMYIFDESNYCLKGRRRGRTFRLGDPIRIEVWRANLLKKQLDFRLAESNITIPKSKETQRKDKQKPAHYSKKKRKS